jgi:uncharacterized protein
MSAANETLSQDTVDEFVGVSHGNVARVRELLEQHPDLVNVSASWVETPIEAAAQMANREIMELLLERGAPVDICTAIALGRDDRVREMLREDPSLKGAKGAHGIPIMYYPVITGNKEIAQLLLDSGADINAGAGGTTPLHGAAIFNRVDMAEWLLMNGADARLADYEGKSPFERAQLLGNAEVAQILNAADEQ